MTYWFKPHGHWNVTSKAAFELLSRFYGPDYLKVTEK